MLLWLTRVESRSMEPTLRDGQLVLTRSLRRTTPIRRGDLVVADSPELGRRVVKRVIGLPGERVVASGAAVTVDGAVLDEPYASRSVFRGRFAVPDEHYLLLGDNRDASNDARSWRDPYLARERIVGRLTLRRPAGRPDPVVRGSRCGWSERWRTGWDTRPRSSASCGRASRRSTTDRAAEAAPGR